MGRPYQDHRLISSLPLECYIEGMAEVFLWIPLLLAAWALVFADTARWLYGNGPFSPYEFVLALACMVLAVVVDIAFVRPDDPDYAPRPYQTLRRRWRRLRRRAWGSLCSSLRFIVNAPLGCSAMIAVPFAGLLLAAAPWWAAGDACEISLGEGCCYFVLGLTGVALFRRLLDLARQRRYRTIASGVEAAASVVEPGTVKEAPGRVAVRWRAGKYWVPNGASVATLDTVGGSMMPNFWEYGYDVDPSAGCCVQYRDSHFLVHDLPNGTNRRLDLNATGIVLTPYRKRGWRSVFTGPHSLRMLAHCQTRDGDVLGLRMVSMSWDGLLHIEPQDDAWNGDFLGEAGELRTFCYSSGPWSALLFHREDGDHLYEYHAELKILTQIDTASTMEGLSLSEQGLLAYFAGGRLVLRQLGSGVLLDVAGPFTCAQLSDSGRYLLARAGTFVCTARQEEGWALKAFQFNGRAQIFDSGEILLARQLASTMRFVPVP
jgi:hypothetical protein